MSRAILGLVFAFGLAAHADSYFDTLSSWYAQGQPVTYEQMRGFYSGRCFEVTEKAIPRNSMLGYTEIRDGRDPGPGLPTPTTEARLNLLIWPRQPADIFDDTFHFPQNRRAFDNETLRFWANLSAPVENPTLGFAIDWEPNGNPDVQVDFVAYGQYFVSRATALITQRYVNGWTGQPFMAQAGSVITMCYYFKPLGN